MALLEGGLLGTVYRELTRREGFARRPEQDLVMNDAESVTAYVKAGRPDGAMSATYLYHAAQMSRMVRPSDLALDLACGPANLLSLVASLNPETRFAGVDLSTGMLGHARQAIAARGLANVELREDDMTALATIADRSVDAVLSSMSLHHLPDAAALDRTFAAIARVLKPDGGVYLFDFGRLKSEASIDYFVGRAAPGEDPALSKDYAQSLRAAFSKHEFAAAAARHLGSRVRVLSTAVTPFLIVIASPPRRELGALARELRDRARALPPARRNDLDQMRLFLRLGGLRSAI